MFKVTSTSSSEGYLALGVDFAFCCQWIILSSGSFAFQGQDNSLKIESSRFQL